MEDLLAEFGGLLQAARLKMLKRRRQRFIPLSPVLSNWRLGLFHAAPWTQATGLWDLSARSTEGSRCLSSGVRVLYPGQCRREAWRASDRGSGRLRAPHNLSCDPWEESIAERSMHYLSAGRHIGSNHFSLIDDAIELFFCHEAEF